MELGDEWKQLESAGDLLDQLISKMRLRFGRLPTEDEVWSFIYGSDWDRLRIWNTEKVGPYTCIAQTTKK